MLTITEQHRVYLVCQPVDFRKGIDGFAGICRSKFYLEPFHGHCFIFRNRRKTAIKILLYDNGGFWLCHKRLSKGKFKHWPTNKESLVSLDTNKLNQFLAQQ
jgi:transposase